MRWQLHVLRFFLGFSRTAILLICRPSPAQGVRFSTILQLILL
jgi:hypothetical protein